MLSNQVKYFSITVLFAIFMYLLSQVGASLDELAKNGFFKYFTNPNYFKESQLNDMYQTNALLGLYKNKLIEIVFKICMAFSSLLVAVYLIFRFRGNGMWLFSMTLSIVFFGAVYYMLNIVVTYQVNEDNVSMIVSNEEQLESFVFNAVAASKEKGEAKLPIFVRTGIYIQNIEFSSANNVIITGYVWQKYDYKKYDTTTIRKGFVFPEAEAYTITPAYAKNYPKEHFEVVGWNFQVTLRETFDYSKYPFDFQNLWLRIWHTDFQQNVVLTPDFAAYDSLGFEQKPGIEENLTLPGWDVAGTFFGYQEKTSKTNFGMPDFAGRENFPEFYFSVLLQRDFVSIFIPEIVPLFMVLVIMYVTLLVSYNRNAMGFFKFNVMELLALVASVIFVLIFVQVDLRRKIPSEKLLYIEYYYFVLYFIIFYILLDFAILHNVNILEKLKIDNHLLIKVFFVPIVLGLILLSTYFTFRQAY